MKLERFTILDSSLTAIIYTAGIIGIRFLPDFFLKTSFISILIPLSLYLFRVKPKGKDILLILSVYSIGFFAEWIGVRFGWLFGSYKYGDSLGIKLDGVPLIIGANWLLLSLVSREVISKLLNNKILIIILSSILMVLIDFLIEPISDNLNFWIWENNIIPYSNYLDWFLIALLNQTLFSFLGYKKDMFHWSLIYITILVLFFLTFYI